MNCGGPFNESHNEDLDGVCPGPRCMPPLSIVLPSIFDPNPQDDGSLRELYPNMTIEYDGGATEIRFMMRFAFPYALGMRSGPIVPLHTAPKPEWLQVNTECQSVSLSCRSCHPQARCHRFASRNGTNNDSSGGTPTASGTGQLCGH